MNFWGALTFILANIKVIGIPFTGAYLLVTHPIEEGEILRKYVLNGGHYFVIEQTGDEGRLLVPEADYYTFRIGETFECIKTRGCKPLDREARVF